MVCCYVGKYYLVDSGYPLREGYMAPYRKNWYHLKEFEMKGPENLNEIFNYHHSCLWNVVERSFGVLKNKVADLTWDTIVSNGEAIEDYCGMFCTPQLCTGLQRS